MTVWDLMVWQELRGFMAVGRPIVEVEVETRWEGRPYLEAQVPYIVPVDSQDNREWERARGGRLFFLPDATEVPE